MQVKFFDYPKLYDEHKKEFDKIIPRTLKSGRYILQEELFNFETNFAKYINSSNVFGVADGTNAIFLSLIALGIGPSDEVLLPAHTYIATASSVHFTGAKAVLVECNDDSLIDCDDLQKKINNRTKAIICVNLNGRVCDMSKLLKISKKNNLYLVEDSAQGVGAKYKNKFAGTFGHLGTYSFYPAKLLGCFGDGGAITTNDSNLAKKIYQLRDHGRDKNGLVKRWGTNSRLDNFQAKILDFKLKHINEYIHKRRLLASYYHERLKDIPFIGLPPKPESSSQNFDTFQNYEARFKNRNKLKKYLSEEGIGTLIQWGGNAVHHFKDLKFKCSLPKTDNFFKECLLLPMNTFLDIKDIKYVCDKIEYFYHN